MSGLGRTAVVPSGEVFADALVAGPFSARGSHPVPLTPPDRLHPEVIFYLSRASVDHVVLMGGTAALSAGVEDALTGLGVTVTRLAGATRYDTAIRAAELVQGRFSDDLADDCFGREHIGLARARVPFDSFSAGPLLARLCAPLLLADPQAVPAETAAFLDSARTAAGGDGIELTAFGGNAAVSTRHCLSISARGSSRSTQKTATAVSAMSQRRQRFPLAHAAVRRPTRPLNCCQTSRRSTPPGRPTAATSPIQAAVRSG